MSATATINRIYRDLEKEKKELGKMCLLKFTEVSTVMVNVEGLVSY